MTVLELFVMAMSVVSLNHTMFGLGNPYAMQVAPSIYSDGGAANTDTLL